MNQDTDQIIQSQLSQYSFVSISSLQVEGKLTFDQSKDALNNHILNNSNDNDKLSNKIYVLITYNHEYGIGQKIVELKDLQNESSIVSIMSGYVYCIKLSIQDDNDESNQRISQAISQFEEEETRFNNELYQLMKDNVVEVNFEFEKTEEASEGEDIQVVPEYEAKQFAKYNKKPAQQAISQQSGESVDKITHQKKGKVQKHRLPKQYKEPFKPFYPNQFQFYGFPRGPPAKGSRTLKNQPSVSKYCKK